MIGAIVLTLRDRKLSRRQDIATQVARVPAQTMELVDIPIGAGVSQLGIRRPIVTEPEAEEVAGDDTGHGHGGH
jgi:NADH-quinone oxidoreductase subunit J